MKFQVVEQELYRKAYKRLSKDYRHLQDGIDNFLDSVKSKRDLGIELKSNLFKAKIKNSDKKRGKSAGYRLISYLAIVENELHLLYIYDKSRLENLTEKEIDNLILQQIKYMKK